MGKKNGTQEEKGTKTTIFEQEKKQNAYYCTQMIFIALTAAITHGYNSCNFHLGDSLGDELHSVWYCFTVLSHYYYYYSYENMVATLRHSLPSFNLYMVFCLTVS